MNNDRHNDDYNPTGPLELFDTTPPSEGTKFTRQRTGRFASDELEQDGPPSSVDRDRDSGQFVSKTRSPEPFRRNTETGRLYRDPYAVGEWMDDDDDVGWP